MWGSLSSDLFTIVAPPEVYILIYYPSLYRILLWSLSYELSTLVRELFVLCEIVNTSKFEVSMRFSG